MALTSTKQGPRRHALDEAFDAYISWRGACVALEADYDAWKHRRARNAALARGAYQHALDREEQTANLYVRLMRSFGGPLESGIALAARPCIRSRRGGSTS